MATDPNDPDNIHDNTERTISTTKARGASEGKPVLNVLWISTGLIVLAALVGFFFIGENDSPGNFGVVETNGEISEPLEQPTTDALAEPTETPTSAQ